MVAEECSSLLPSRHSGGKACMEGFTEEMGKQDREKIMHWCSAAWFHSASKYLGFFSYLDIYFYILKSY